MALLIFGYKWRTTFFLIKGYDSFLSPLPSLRSSSSQERHHVTTNCLITFFPSSTHHYHHLHLPFSSSVAEPHLHHHLFSSFSVSLHLRLHSHHLFFLPSFVLQPPSPPLSLHLIIIINIILQLCLAISHHRFVPTAFFLQQGCEQQ